MSTRKEGAGARVGAGIRIAGPHQHTPSAETKIRRFFSDVPDECLTRADAEAKFSVCSHIIRAAFKRLEAEGFLMREGKRGQSIWRRKDAT